MNLNARRGKLAPDFTLEVTLPDQLYRIRYVLSITNRADDLESDFVGYLFVGHKWPWFEVVFEFRITIGDFEIEDTNVFGVSTY